MSDYNDRPTSVTVTRGSGGGLYFIVGALLVLVLVGSYVMMGAPGLNTQVANGPAPVGEDRRDGPAAGRSGDARARPRATSRFAPGPPLIRPPY